MSTRKDLPQRLIGDLEEFAKEVDESGGRTAADTSAASPASSYWQGGGQTAAGNAAASSSSAAPYYPRGASTSGCVFFIIGVVFELGTEVVILLEEGMVFELERG